MELALRFGDKGFASQVSVIRSSRYYAIDRAVLKGLSVYRFDTKGLTPGKEWRVFFSWSEDGRKTKLSGSC